VKEHNTIIINAIANFEFLNTFENSLLKKFFLILFLFNLSQQSKINKLTQFYNLNLDSWKCFINIELAFLIYLPTPPDFYTLRNKSLNQLDSHS